jgi:hypothetical protein
MVEKTALAMREQLTIPRNMQKNLWFSMTDREIVQRIDEELDELKDIIFSSRLSSETYKRNVIKEAADVCNFLGFLIDNQGMIE